MNDPFKDLPEESRRELRRRAPPPWIPPMLATLTHRRFSDPAWIFERKLDGIRLLAFRVGDDLRLLTRNRLRRNGAYPEIAEALGRLPVRDFVVDGEVVALVRGRTSFERLQGRMQISDPDAARATGIAVSYYVFDLIYLAGYEVTGLPLRERKRLLRRAFAFQDLLRFLSHRKGAGEAFLREACRKGWEGLLAKRADSAYESRRSRNWLKFKCANRQEFVIGGFTDREGERAGFGALLIGYHEAGGLRYAGKVGTGFDDRTLKSLRRRLGGLTRSAPPFPDAGLSERGVHWVTPELVCEVDFTEWTDRGKLRHPRFVGLRDDKDPREVVRERPAPS